MQVTLLSVADARLGAYEKPADGGTHLFLLPSNLNAAADQQQRVILTDNAKRALLREGQVLLTAKGTQPRATLVTEFLAGMVASSGFFIITPNAELLPAFLVACLNHADGQRQLRDLLQLNTTVPALNKSDLQRLEIPLPPLAMQHRMANLAQAWQHEQALTQQLLQQKELLYQQAFAAGLA